MQRIYVYVSGPISQGDQIVNCRELVLASHALMGLQFERGMLIPFNPGASLVSHAIDPQDYEAWLTWDMAWVERCDSLLAIRPWIPSTGRDREMEHARKHCRKVSRSLVDLVEFWRHFLGAPDSAAVQAFDARWCVPPMPPAA